MIEGPTTSDGWRESVPSKRQAINDALDACGATWKGTYPAFPIQRTFEQFMGRERNAWLCPTCEPYGRARDRHRPVHPLLNHYCSVKYYTSPRGSLTECTCTATFSHITDSPPRGRFAVAA